MPRVFLENLSKIFPGPNGKSVLAVNDITLAVEDKQCLALVGPSGCGKTTTLRLIAGLEEVSGGTVFIDGRALNDVPAADRNIAMVFQNYALYPHMTVYENLALGLRLRKFSRTEIARRVKEAAEILGLGGCLDRLPKALSGGERQRVAVGRAIVRRPEVFLFDEPLSNLDAQMRVQLRAEISRLHRRLEATMIYVTHDQFEAMAVGGRIAVMKAGVIEQVADPMTLYHEPVNRFVAGFIGSPPMNFMRGQLTRKDNRLWFQEQHGAGRGNLMVGIPEAMAPKLTAYREKAVLLGLRPEAIHVQQPPEIATNETSAEAVVEHAQPMGSETYLHLNTGAHRLVGRAGAGHHFSLSEKVSLVFDMGQAHFFDPERETAIK